eukprot:XP_001691751.1 predicted protein [Chlamydomonas reinhardtii]
MHRNCLPLTPHPGACEIGESCVPLRRLPQQQTPQLSQPSAPQRSVRVRFRENDKDAATRADRAKPSAAGQPQQPPQQQYVPVVLQYTKHCAFGHGYAVVGSVPELGSWDPNRAVRMQWTDGDTWQAVVRLPVDTDVQYKYVLVKMDGGGLVCWEGAEQAAGRRRAAGRARSGAAPPPAAGRRAGVVAGVVDMARGTLEAIESRLPGMAATRDVGVGAASMAADAPPPPVTVAGAPAHLRRAQGIGKLDPNAEVDSSGLARYMECDDHENPVTPLIVTTRRDVSRVVPRRCCTPPEGGGYFVLDSGASGFVVTPQAFGETHAASVSGKVAARFIRLGAWALGGLSISKPVLMVMELEGLVKGAPGEVTVPYSLHEMGLHHPLEYGNERGWVWHPLVMAPVTPLPCTLQRALPSAHPAHHHPLGPTLTFDLGTDSFSPMV